MTAHVSRNETPVVTWPASTDPIEVLDWATRRFGDRITLSTSMGPQTLVVLDMVAALGREVPAFVLDTGYLFPETYALWERVQKRYGIRIDGVRATAPQRAEAALWKTNPDRCCAIRKVDPLAEYLTHFDAWITGLRRDQSTTRAATQTVMRDDAHGLLKVNPLAHWTRDQVLTYAVEQGVELNPLLALGYRSVGCTHCTARPDASADPDDERAGRWVGREKTECGIHWGSLGIPQPA